MFYPGYLLRMLSGVRYDKFKEVLDRVQRFSGMSRAAITADMVRSAFNINQQEFPHPL